MFTEMDQDAEFDNLSRCFFIASSKRSVSWTQREKMAERKKEREA